MSCLSFDLCSIFDIENNWNGVLEQDGRPWQREEEGGREEEEVDGVQEAF